MTAVKEMVAAIASRQATVLILGETGTGKEMLARHIHALSPRRDGPFIPVDCSALTESLFESQLFGHVRGAFTGAVRDSLGSVRSAHGGTLFLDELGELPLVAQAKLLRVLQERCVTPVGDARPRPVDARVLAATNRDLADMVRRGTFRQDLWFRVNVISIQIPPLREHPSDIPALARHFLRMQAEFYGEPEKTPSPEAAVAMARYDWPGNVRELANALEHAHALSPTNVISLPDLPARVHSPADAPAACELNLLALERRAIAEAMKRTCNCKAAASRLLGIDVKRLRRRLAFHQTNRS